MTRISISLIEAVELILNGEPVYVVSELDPSVTLADLREMAEGFEFYRDLDEEPVKEEPKEEPEIVPDEELSVDDILDNLDEHMEQAEAESEPPKKKVVDKSKVFELLDRGWNKVDIANKLGVHISTVYNVIKRGR